MTIYCRKNKEGMEIVISILRNGGIAILPTNSVYGIATNANYESSVKKIYEIKGRDDTKPLSYYTSVKQAQSLGSFDYQALEIMKLWPRAVSIIINKSDKVPDYVTRGKDSVLLTCLDSYIEELVNSADFPIVATSANLSNSPALTDFISVKKQFDNIVDVIMDGGESLNKKSSTIIDLSVTPPKILREGVIEYSALKSLLPNLRPYSE